jgi:hypothetical protein
MQRIIKINRFSIDLSCIIGIGPMKQRTEYNYSVLSFDVLLQFQLLKFEQKFLTYELKSNTKENERFEDFWQEYYEVEESIRKSIAARKTSFLSPSKKR